jgi:hypothetical protein
LGIVSAPPDASKLERRVTAAAQALLDDRHVVAPLDVLQAIGWLTAPAVERWRRGQPACLADVVAVTPARLADMLAILRRWADDHDLQPTAIVYVTSARDRPSLRFTADGDRATERSFTTQWTARQLPEATRQRLVAHREKPPDLVVVAASRPWSCAECTETGDLLIMEAGQPLCLRCADMDHLVFVPAGDAALTRRAKKAATLSAVVVRFNKTRKRYDRQGILVEQSALETAEHQCLGDAEARERRRERDHERRVGQDATLITRMAEEIIRLFTGCPPPRAAAIAAHTGLRGSGRVGRSAAGRALADEALQRAVIASIRHEDTDYDRLLMSGMARAEAREKIRTEIDRILDAWQAA